MKASIISMKSPIALHSGQALLRLADTYPLLQDVLLELIQNAIDASADHIWVTVNTEARNLTIADNGDGRSRQEFEAALVSICSSVKPEGKLGRFGLGLISPLNKCQGFTFTSTTKHDPRGYLEWNFVTEDIRRQKELNGIPLRKRSDLVYSGSIPTPRRGEHGVPWRTQVRLTNYTSDRMIGRISIDTLRDQILQNFGPTMRRLQTTVTVRVYEGEKPDALVRDIVAEKYSGRKLEETTIHDSEAGTTTFQLFMARKDDRGYHGKVSLGEAHNEFRVSAMSFARSAEGLVSDEVLQALQSGVFEGEILTERARVQANRKRFAPSDQFVGFCATIEQWFKQVGSKHFDMVREETRDTRYQQIGVKSLMAIEALLKENDFQGLREIIGLFQFGTIGPGHAEPSKTRVKGQQEERSKALDGDRPSTNGEHGSDRERKETGKPKANHTPYSVIGEGGNRRRIVKSDSLGLQISLEAMEGSSKAYELDTAYGILRFNIRHPLWQQCEQNDQTLTKYIEYVVLQALILKGVPEEWVKFTEPAFNDMLPAYCYLLTHANPAKRKPTSKQSKQKKAVA